MITIHQEARETLADLLRALGDVPPSRVLLCPPPGTATEEDLLAWARKGRLCELVDGTLVEKAMGFKQSALAAALISFLREFVVSRNLGIVTGADGSMRFLEGLVRAPDVAYVSWSRLPGGRMPDVPIPGVAPELAVEVLSSGNRPGEMARKRKEYFDAGVLLVWEIDPEDRTVAIYAEPGRPEVVLRAGDRLEGGDALPGFALLVQDLFAELDRQAGG